MHYDDGEESDVDRWSIWRLVRINCCSDCFTAIIFRSVLQQHWCLAAVTVRTLPRKLCNTCTWCSRCQNLNLLSQSLPLTCIFDAGVHARHA